MIRISGRPFDTSTLMGEFPRDSIERKVLDTMSASDGRYQYDSVEQLKFELELRREIVKAARELNGSKMSFAVFHKSRCNKKYWERTNNGGFRLKKDARPSDGIRDIFINGSQYATECATAMVIVYYKALLNIFGDELFNRLFPDIYLMNWQIIDPLLKEIGTPRAVSDILLGDRGYFANPDVNPETPELQGENVIVLPDGLYYGHGMGIRTAEAIIRILNANRKKNAVKSAYFMDSAGRPNFKKLADIYYSFSPRKPLLDWQTFPTLELQEVQF